MTYTVRKLITKSFYLSGVVAREFQTVSGSQITDGLDLLNALLAFKTADSKLIPYYRRYAFDMTPGDGEYYIENLYKVDALTFNLDETVRYPIEKASRHEFFNTGRVLNIDSLPAMWHGEREKGGMRLYFYFDPISDYTVQLSGKFGLTNVALDDDLEDTYDDAYIEYLRFALAEYICMDWGMDFAPNKAKQLQKMIQQLSRLSPADITIRKRSILTSKGAMNWGAINIGRGWTP
jgi:hypothetical protein